MGVKPLNEHRAIKIMSVELLTDLNNERGVAEMMNLELLIVSRWA